LALQVLLPIGMVSQMRAIPAQGFHTAT